MAILLDRHDFMWKTKMNEMSMNKTVKDFTKGSISKQMFMLFFDDTEVHLLSGKWEKKTLADEL